MNTTNKNLLNLLFLLVAILVFGLSACTPEGETTISNDAPTSEVETVARDAEPTDAVTANNPLVCDDSSAMYDAEACVELAASLVEAAGAADDSVMESAAVEPAAPAEGMTDEEIAALAAELAANIVAERDSANAYPGPDTEEPDAPAITVVEDNGCNDHPAYTVAFFRGAQEATNSVDALINYLNEEVEESTGYCDFGPGSRIPAGSMLWTNFFEQYSDVAPEGCIAKAEVPAGFYGVFVTLEECVMPDSIHGRYIKFEDVEAVISESETTTSRPESATATTVVAVEPTTICASDALIEEGLDALNAHFEEIGWQSPEAQNGPFDGVTIPAGYVVLSSFDGNPPAGVTSMGENIWVTTQEITPTGSGRAMLYCGGAD